MEMGMMWLVTWFARLIADCTALRALLSQPLPYTQCPDLQVHALQESAYHSATTLARGIYFHSQLQSMTYVTILSVVLEMLEAFFAENGNLEEMGWCSACRIATELRLKRLEKVRPRTLCQIRQVAPQHVAAVRFQPRKQAPTTDSLACPIANV